MTETPDSFARARRRMVAEQVQARGIHDPATLQALRTVPRHEFVPASLAARAYSDEALQLGPGQSISQPYVVALMTTAASLSATDRVLEIGTGSGYQAAVLAELVGEVCTIEQDEALARAAEQRLRRLCYRNIRVRHGDGGLGWPELAPFNAILITAAVAQVPQRLLDQLAIHGRLIAPVVTTQDSQMLRRIEKSPNGRLERKDLTAVRFVPFVYR